jgi:hypothetical protein
MDTPRTSDSTNAGPGQLLEGRYRCPGRPARFSVRGKLSEDAGYFRLGPDICYGRCSSGTPAKSVTDTLHDAGAGVTTNGASLELPFDPAQVVDSLRSERYLNFANLGAPSLANKTVRNAYYLLRPLMPVHVRKHFQRLYFRRRIQTPFPHWPVDRTVDNIIEQLMSFAMKSQNVAKIPFIWFWPEGANSCTMLTHDVETSAGLKFCPHLMDLDDSFGVKSSFQLVPEKRYVIPDSLMQTMRTRGFDVNVHDLNHDGKLFVERDQFMRRAERINGYARQFQAAGFRSAVMYRNVDWYDALDVSYDMSIPNVAHMEPQQGGCCTVLPFFVGKILELPLTTTQDYSLFHILRQFSIKLWQEQISLIRQKNGLISFGIHPDYIISKKACRVYIELLQYLAGLRERKETWIASPNQVAAWWRLRSKLTLVKDGASWRIEGEGCERARVAYAVLRGDKLTYDV